jgi:hypothetical protein
MAKSFPVKIADFLIDFSLDSVSISKGKKKIDQEVSRQDLIDIHEQLTSCLRCHGIIENTNPAPANRVASTIRNQELNTPPDVAVLKSAPYEIKLSGSEKALIERDHGPGSSNVGVVRVGLEKSSRPQAPMVNESAKNLIQNDTGISVDRVGDSNVYDSDEQSDEA